MAAAKKKAKAKANKAAPAPATIPPHILRKTVSELQEELRSFNIPYPHGSRKDALVAIFHQNVQSNKIALKQRTKGEKAVRQQDEDHDENTEDDDDEESQDASDYNLVPANKKKSSSSPKSTSADERADQIRRRDLRRAQFDESLHPRPPLSEPISLANYRFFKGDTTEDVRDEEIAFAQKKASRTPPPRMKSPRQSPSLLRRLKTRPSTRSVWRR
jgi:hypothetical protein